mmetsp:Transcript_5323/g.13769  ORF Transcript_5323/g.13769 Transcript_5323/m.13769 type:complete len:255 (+) Transcript_5323:893-1657(+)
MRAGATPARRARWSPSPSRATCPRSRPCRRRTCAAHRSPASARPRPKPPRRSPPGAVRRRSWTPMPPGRRVRGAATAWRQQIRLSPCLPSRPRGAGAPAPVLPLPTLRLLQQTGLGVRPDAGLGVAQAVRRPAGMGSPGGAPRGAGVAGPAPLRRRTQRSRRWDPWRQLLPRPVKILRTSALTRRLAGSCSALPAARARRRFEPLSPGAWRRSTQTKTAPRWRSSCRRTRTRWRWHPRPGRERTRTCKASSALQ